ncbi:hypothetical protein GCM10012286_22790 [Streptomyces lasiicapitis]|uniref:Uncharacterized protein n=1 Tax=Streptomyces lasiicapitis TaxID=1923961 RepID=A0ABQ2LQJ3_9ACTN|nr:hypothetical protein GCM10012286_22790 [Streptomyces lasiicapitis]
MWRRQAQVRVYGTSSAPVQAKASAPAFGPPRPAVLPPGCDQSLRRPSDGHNGIPAASRKSGSQGL